MAIVYDSPVLPDDLTEYVRNVPTPSNFILSQWLPNDYLDVNQVDIGTLTSTNRVARFRVWDGPLHVAQRDTASVKSIKLPPLSDSRSIGELERLKIEFARTGGTRQDLFTKAIYDEAGQLTRYVQNRMELARGDVLTDGVFTMLSSNGEPALTVDYGVPGGNIVTAGTLWSTTASADPLTDLNTWQTAYNTLNGFDFGGMIISRTILNYLLANTAMRTLTGTLVGAPTLITRDQVNQALDARGLPPIVGVYDSRVDVDGTSTRVTAANKVYFVPPADQRLGRTVWGVTATALELVNSNSVDLDFSQAAGIVGVVVKEGPPFVEHTFVDACGLPVIDNPNFLMVATVA
jgi:hypothetical protein